jgi:hypothetical protein
LETPGIYCKLTLNESQIGCEFIDSIHLAQLQAFANHVDEISAEVKAGSVNNLLQTIRDVTLFKHSKIFEGLGIVSQSVVFGH